MKIKIIENPLIKDLEVHILCEKRNAYVEFLVSALSEKSIIINGKLENEYTKLSSADIYYFESVDNNTYIYCENKVYRSDLKLYELEEKLSGTEFSRINKSCIMNTSRLEKVKGQINGRLLATLTNGEKLIINRSYVPEIKRKLKISFNRAGGTP